MTVDEVRALVADLPEVTEGERRGQQTWSVHGKTFAWVRPFTKADIKRFGAEPVPDGPILAVRVADLGEKEAVLAAGRTALFTIAHFDGFAAVLVKLDEVDRADLREALVDGWLACAPSTLSAAYLQQ